jgi:peptidoglycan/xylan/chitin deacetylase (PgdA/CDA1 family)
MFAGEVGTPRLVTLFDRLQIPTTWFIPGHSIETVPKQMAAVAAAVVGDGRRMWTCRRRAARLHRWLRCSMRRNMMP